MKNFEKFVDLIVSTWRNEKKEILKNAGLSGTSSRVSGDIAEKYVKDKRIKNLKPEYNAFISSGSQTPSDIYAVSLRNGYWHIMLIQVKSSKAKETIYQLNRNDILEFRELAKFVKKKTNDFAPFKRYKGKPIIISTGFANVWNIKTKNGTSHRLIDAKLLDTYKLNCSALDIDKAIRTIENTHKL